MSEKPSSLSPEIRDIWTDVYKFHATFEGMGNSEEDWTRCAYTMGQIAAQHNNHPLAFRLLMAVYDYLDDMRKPLAKAEAERRACIDQAV